MSINLRIDLFIEIIDWCIYDFLIINKDFDFTTYNNEAEQIAIYINNLKKIIKSEIFVNCVLENKNNIKTLIFHMLKCSNHYVNLLKSIQNLVMEITNIGIEDIIKSE
jgi:hypothetical protein